MPVTFRTETELAELLGIPVERAAEHRRRYGWPHLKIGREVRYTESDVRAIEAKHHVSPERPEGLPGQTPRSIARSA